MRYQREGGMLRISEICGSPGSGPIRSRRRAWVSRSRTSAGVMGVRSLSSHGRQETYAAHAWPESAFEVAAGAHESIPRRCRVSILGLLRRTVHDDLFRRSGTPRTL